MNNTITKLKELIENALDEHLLFSDEKVLSGYSSKSLNALLQHLASQLDFARHLQIRQQLLRFIT